MTETPDTPPPDPAVHDWLADGLPDSPGSFFRPGEKEPPRPEPGLAPGKVVGDFRLISLIGQGGMGQVWEAEQVSLRRRVAVKFVRPERVTRKHLEYFEREARAGGRLSHPGIVSVHGYGESDGLAWIAMELVEGAWTLRDFLDEVSREGEVPRDYDRHVARFVRDLARAMHAAHEGGVIHRDLKPQNVLITPENQPKVTDFGLARITDESALSATGEFAGTYFYMSPEQVAARRMGIDHRTDVFSLGVVLYEMLALVRPFQGDTSHQVAAQIVTKDPPDPRTIRSRIPRDLVVICGKALEKDRDRRFASMAELADDLDRFLANEPILAKPPTPVQRVVKWVRRNPTKSLSGAVAVVAFAVISALLVQIAGQRDELATKTADLEEANTSLEARTAELQESNTALEAKTDEANRNATQAQENARQAEANALAERRRADEVLRLSLSQDYEDLMSEAGALWPAYPEKIEEYERWIGEARSVVEQLPELRAKREELRRDALPRSEEQRVAERESHPEFAKLEPLADRIESMRKALAVRRGEAEAELPTLDWGELPEDASGLNSLAWPLVDPAREVVGRELVGLALAERAVGLAAAEERSTILDTLAWARFAAGDHEGALEASRSALEGAAEEQQPEYEGYLAKLEAAIDAAGGEQGLSDAESEITRLGEEHAALDARVDERRDWSFPEEKSDSRWWNNQLTKLIDELESLTAAKTGLLTEEGVSAGHGWSMVRRLRFAERLRDGFAPGGEFALRWEEALPAIRTAYPGLDLVAQLGLVPIGADPDSKLWEFWHVQSGTEPVRGEDGRLSMEESSGLVFVLLPGGTFWMGAQKEDPDGRNYDPAAQSDEGPVHEVELSAFFLSKYEMTQGQWKRLAGSNPSRYGPDGTYGTSWNREGKEPTLLEPVEQVSWYDCVGLLSKLGLVLPSEAQWEYGARGGTETSWWSGSEKESLQGTANLADRYARDHGGSGWTGIEEWLDDGYTSHAPVNTLEANDFGLHHVHGNLWEWCLDGYDGNSYRKEQVIDPVVRPMGSTNRVGRGGSFGDAAANARSAGRDHATPAGADDDVGLRVVRVITD